MLRGVPSAFDYYSSDQQKLVFSRGIRGFISYSVELLFDLVLSQ
jgi:hypothetical protein